MTEVEPQESKCPHNATAAREKAKSRGLISDDPQLPKREIAFYLVALVSIITYAGYDFYLTYGRDPTEKLPPFMLNNGWLRKFMDNGEDSLMTHAAIIWKEMLVASIGFLFVSKATLLWTPMPCHQIVCSVYTLVMTALAISPKAAVTMTASYAILLCLSYYSHALAWVAVVTMLYLHNIKNIIYYIADQLELTDVSVGRYAAIHGYLICRLISFSHSLSSRLSQRRQNSEPIPSLLEYIRENLPATLHYTFYMPYHWCGPILTFDTFNEQLVSRGRVASVDKATAIRVTWRCCRILFWYFVMQVIFHYLPVGSYLYTLKAEDKIVYKHLSFAMFLNGQNFMLMYVQFYGWPGSLAKLDGIQLLHWPDCISWVYSYTIMWRVFDRGLFVILHAHIYVPIGGHKQQQQGVLRQVLGAVASFAFICIFHGDSSNIRAWTALNCVHLLTERLAIHLYRRHLRATVTQYFSPQNEKRIVGYIISWNMMASCGIIFFFLAGTNGFIVMPEFLLLRGSASSHTPVWHMLIAQFATYCCVQIGRYYEVKMRHGCCAGKAHKD